MANILQPEPCHHPGGPELQPGYAWDVVGIDLGGFGAYDLAVDESNGVSEEKRILLLGRPVGFRW